MAAEYESGAGVIISKANGATAAGERDWHGLGKPLTPNATLQQRLREASLDWMVEMRPVFVDGREVEGMKACVRMSDGKVFYIGDAKRNKIDFRQNEDVAGEFDTVAAKLGLTPSYMCSLKGGTTVALTYAPEANSYEDPTGSRVDFFISALLNKSPGNRTIHLLQAETRIVCSNTKAVAIREAEASGKQARIISSARITEGDIARMLENIYAGVTEQRRMQSRMANDKLSEGDAAKLFATVAGVNLADLDKTVRNAKGEAVPMVSTKARNILAALDLSYRNAPGATPGTALGALNALTHYTTHVRTVRDTMGDGEQGARVAANLFGDGAAMVAKAEAMLQARYAVAA